MKIETTPNLISRFLYLSFGFIFLIIGLIGLVLPVLPGFVFLIPAIICFAKGSSNFNKMIKRNKLIGKYFQ